MATPVLPRAQSAIAGRELPAATWYDFFRDLLAFVQANEGNTAEIEAILARIEELEENQTGPFTIAGLMSVQVDGLPQNGVVQAQLVNDSEAPGENYYYGTDLAGTKGFYKLLAPQLVVVQTVADFPDPVAGVITLAADTGYLITDLIDMTGVRIVCGTSNTLEGVSSAACGLLFPDTLGATRITGSSSLAMRNLQLQSAADPLFSLNNGATGVLLWTGIQVLNTPTFGTIANYQNVVWKDTIVFNTANLTLDGTFASFVAETSLFDGRSGQTTITVPSTATFLRRFRMLYTAFQVDAGETGINFSTSATIPDESYILDNVSFSGAGTYLAGVTYTSNKALFFNCSGTGFVNSNAVTQYTMTGNATATVIGGTGTFVKIAGTTVTESAVEQKFNTATTNRAQYTGAFIGSFLVTVFASMTSGNNQNLRMRIAVNGTTVAASNTLFQTSGSGAASNIGTQLLRTLNPNDYIEVFVANDTAANNITVSDLNVTVTKF